MSTKTPKVIKPKKVKEKKVTSSLLEALAFVLPIQKDKGTLQETHVAIFNKQIIAFNGVLALGHAITDDLNVCPHTHLFKEALDKCGEHFTLTQLDTNKLSVRNDKFKAFIPCLSFADLSPIAPDPIAGEVNDVLLKGFEILAPVITDSGDYVLTSSINLKTGSMVATDRHMIIEFWHGLNMPDMIIPKALIVQMLKCKKSISHFGFSDNTITFYFQDNSWIRSQLYKESYPNIDKILSVKSEPKPVPPGFYDAIKAIECFTKENNTVMFDANLVKTSNDDTTGAAYTVKGLPAGPAFNPKYLLMIETYVTGIDFVGPNGAYFFGDNLRGAIAGKRV